jgi:Ribonuclease G/E
VTRIRAVVSPGEVRVLAEQDGTLLDYAIWRPGRPDGVGDLHRGRIQAKVPQMAGAFVLIEGATGFLPDSEGGAAATEGEALTVRVTRAAQGGKGPRLSAHLTPDEAGTAERVQAPRLLRRGPGAVERLAAIYPDAPVLADDPVLVASLRPRLGEQIAIGQNLLDDHLAEQVDALGGSEVALPGGLRARIHPTPALIAIDVDTAGATAGRQPKHAALLALNRAALPGLSAQLRLRNLSGAILIDLAGLSPKRRATLAPDLAAALATDPLRPRLLGFTQLGLAELVRPRVHPPLHELLSGPHAAGLAALRALERAGAGRLRASPDVAAAIEGDRVARDDLARRTGRALMLRVDPTLAAGGWVLES